MRKGKLLLWISWFAAVAILILLTVYNKDKTDRFLGLTSSKEDTITFPYSVLVEEVYVKAGQNVKAGDVLADVRRVSENTQSALLGYKIDAIEAKKSNAFNTLKSKIDELAISHDAQNTNIDNDIKALRLKIQKNRQLANSLDGIDFHIDNSTWQFKINALKDKKAFIEQKYLLKRTRLQRELTQNAGPMDANIRGLDVKKTQLLDKTKVQQILAKNDEQIGDVNYRKGNYVKNFSKIITTHPVSPEYVTGFIHEDIENTLKVGQTVYIEPLSELYKSDHVYKGKVLSISSRIEGFPIRLKRYKIVPLWGYKVLIKIENTSLKLGQKVAVSTIDTSVANMSNVEKVLRFLKLK